MCGTVVKRPSGLMKKFGMVVCYKIRGQPAFAVKKHSRHEAAMMSRIVQSSMIRPLLSVCYPCEKDLICSRNTTLHVDHASDRRVPVSRLCAPPIVEMSHLGMMTDGGTSKSGQSALTSSSARTCTYCMPSVDSTLFRSPCRPRGIRYVIVFLHTPSLSRWYDLPQLESARLSL
jgi:hypothetical protein